MFIRLLRTTLLTGSLGVAAATFAGVSGCTQTGRGAIPDKAEELTSGKGNLTATATRTGTIWILDETENKLAWSGGVRADDKIEVNASGDRIIVDGRVKGEPNLDPDHRYTIFYRK